MDYKEIDFNKLWQKAHRQKSYSAKSREDWNHKAAGFEKRHAHSGFSQKFLELLNPEPQSSILDIGAGPGTLTVPLARRVKKVTAVDYAPKMLELLQQAARQANLVNIKTVEAAWEDDWHALGLKPHDIVIACRSLAVGNLAAALSKMNEFASKSGVVVDRVGTTPFDPDAFAAIGRKFAPGPDYIYTVNILYQMGIRARIDFITLEPVVVFRSRAEAVESYTWMFDHVTPREKEKLAAYIDDNLIAAPAGQWHLQQRTPLKWAFIEWKKDGRRS